MNGTLTIDLPKIYREAEIPEFEEGHHRIEELNKELLYHLKIREMTAKGFIRLAIKKVYWDVPPKFSGKPLSEYVKEIKE